MPVKLRKSADNSTKVIRSADPRVEQMENYAKTLRMRHSSTLTDLLQGLECNFAGNIYRDTQSGQMRQLGDLLPPYVIPMYAPFEQPYTGEFLCKLLQAKMYIDRHQEAGEEAYFPYLVVPIRSPGGDIDTLKGILQSLDTFRQTYGIQIIAYLSGMVASCAFILAQMADHILTDSMARMLCHDPSQSQAVRANPGEGVAMFSTTERSARTLERSLNRTRKDIFKNAELGILLRFITRKTADCGEWKHKSLALMEELLANPTLIEQWRLDWYEKHKDMLKYIHSTLSETDLPPLTKHGNILDYVIETVAEDRNSFEIETEWLQKLDMVDLISVDLTIVQADSIQITRSLRSAVLLKMEETTPADQAKSKDSPDTPP